MHGADTQDGGTPVALASAVDGAQDVLGTVVPKHGASVGAKVDGDGGAAKPYFRSSGRDGVVEEAEDGEEGRKASPQEGESRPAARPLVHGGDVVGDDAVAWRVLGPASDEAGKFLRSL